MYETSFLYNCCRETRAKRTYMLVWVCMTNEVEVVLVGDCQRCMTSLRPDRKNAYLVV
jgi:hypothetical protein